MQLRNRIINLLQSGSIADEEEKQKLEFLLKTKKWNPYCIRRSAITSDSDFSRICIEEKGQVVNEFKTGSQVHQKEDGK